jgi:glycosyltransferase involved in cell wall biosynthesis
MTDPTVAVILSNFNHGRYLSDSLGAICGQTRPPDEIIVIDDGSTDDSVTIIEAFARREPALRFLRNERNLGLQASIARALPLVKSDYVVWAASDDRLLPDFLKKSMAVLSRYPEAGLCFSELSVITGDTGEIQRFAVLPEIEHIFDLSDLPEFMTPADIVRRMRRAYLPMTSNSVVVRRDALLAIGGYPKSLEWHSDSFAYTLVALRFGACVIPETLALIRASTGSYSDRGMHDPVRQTQVLTTMLEMLARPEYRDIRRVFRACPSNFSPWHTLMLRVQLRSPRDWDLFATYFLWKVEEYKRGHHLGWPKALAALALRALEGAGFGLLKAVPGVRPAVRLVLWLTGWRHYPWTENPLHRGLAAASRVASRGRTRAHRIAYFASCALLKHRDLVHGGRPRCIALLRGRVSQATLRNIVIWQHCLLKSPEARASRVHGTFCVSGDGDAAQMDQLVSLLCVSDVFDCFDISWQEPGRVDAPTLVPLRQGWSVAPSERVYFDLSDASPPAAPAVELAGVPEAFSHSSEPLRAVNTYLKSAHLRRFIVALGLIEDDEGFCDRSLREWLPYLRRFREDTPDVSFCLLNRTMLGAAPDDAPPVDFAPVRGLGLGLQEAVALAQKASAYLGPMDVFGLAAISAGRPGVYYGATSGDRHELERLQWVLKSSAPGDCLAALHELILRYRLGSET